MRHGRRRPWRRCSIAASRRVRSNFGSWLIAAFMGDCSAGRGDYRMTPCQTCSTRCFLRGVIRRRLTQIGFGRAALVVAGPAHRGHFKRPCVVTMVVVARGDSTVRAQKLGGGWNASGLHSIGDCLVRLSPTECVGATWRAEAPEEMAVRDVIAAVEAGSSSHHAPDFRSTLRLTSFSGRPLGCHGHDLSATRCHTMSGRRSSHDTADSRSIAGQKSSGTPRVTQFETC